MAVARKCSFSWHLFDAPDADMSEESSRVTFWSKFITAINPDTNRPPDNLHPSSLPPEQLSNTVDCLTACLNRFQRHKCSGGYCLRTKKGSKENICRFGFPRSLQEISTVTVEPDRGFWSFAPQRNDSLLNQYNPVLTMAWMANTDVNPITSLQAVIQYVAGYIGKGEKKSSPLGIFFDRFYQSLTVGNLSSLLLRKC